MFAITFDVSPLCHARWSIFSNRCSAIAALQVTRKLSHEQLALIVLRALLSAIFLLPFLLAQGPGCEHVGQALRFCFSDLVKMKAVPARTCAGREVGLDLGEQRLNAKGAGLHGWVALSRAAFVLSRATRSGISSMRASSCASFCVSRHARIMIVAAFLGAFPVDASPPRTAVVVEAGGRSQLSALVAAVIVLVLVLWGSALLDHVPEAALAGVLLFVAQ